MPRKTTAKYIKIDLKKRLFNFPLKFLAIISRSFAPCKIPIVKTPNPQNKLIKLFDNKGTIKINSMVIEMLIW